MPNTMTPLGRAVKRAEATGKAHIWWDGTHWNAAIPGGYSGHLAATPSKALEYARQGPEWFKRLDEYAAEQKRRSDDDERRRERIEDARERDEHRASRVWLASDPDAPRPNTRIVC